MFKMTDCPVQSGTSVHFIFWPIGATTVRSGICALAAAAAALSVCLLVIRRCTFICFALLQSTQRVPSLERTRPTNAYPFYATISCEH